jgi:hypothetical protein
LSRKNRFPLHYTTHTPLYLFFLSQPIISELKVKIENELKTYLVIVIKLTLSHVAVGNMQVGNVKIKFNP